MPNGDVLVAVVMRVQDRYENGAPENLTYIPDDMTCELSEDVSKNEFVIAYVTRKSFKID